MRRARRRCTHGGARRRRGARRSWRGAGRGRGGGGEDRGWGDVVVVGDFSFWLRNTKYEKLCVCVREGHFDAR